VPVASLLNAPTIATNQLLANQQALYTILSNFATVTTEFAQAQATANQRTSTDASTRSPGTYANTSQATAVLNRIGLPADVRRRYDNRDKPMTPSRFFPFQTGDYFFHNPAVGTGKYLSIVITGHILFHEYNSKTFQKTTPKCLADDMAHLRMFYQELYALITVSTFHITFCFAMHPSCVTQDLVSNLVQEKMFHPNSKSDYLLGLPTSCMHFEKPFRKHHASIRSHTWKRMDTKLYK
jgi:hypothetical protein